METEDCVLRGGDRIAGTRWSTLLGLDIALYQRPRHGVAGAYERHRP